MSNYFLLPNLRFPTREDKRVAQSGFTIIEMMVSIGILLVLFALATINLSRLPSATSQAASYDVLIGDFRNQQTKAMSGYNSDPAAAAGSAYGIHFGTTSYTLFKGLAYSEGDPTNFVINLDPGLSFAGSTFPPAWNNSVVFSTGSGEVLNYISGQDSISIKDEIIGGMKVVRINKYGATY
jgi:prepilin-type N-terminal cleavage/methylation domain-containing protein